MFLKLQQHDINLRRTFKTLVTNTLSAYGRSLKGKSGTAMGSCVGLVFPTVLHKV